MPECEDPADITQLMQLAGAGDREARESLYRVVYDDLRRLACNLMRSRSSGDLESTALVNEVVLRCSGGLTIAQTAEMLEISAGSVERDWRLARAQLFRILRGSAG